MLCVRRGAAHSMEPLLLRYVQLAHRFERSNTWRLSAGTLVDLYETWRIRENLKHVTKANEVNVRDTTKAIEDTKTQSYKAGYTKGRDDGVAAGRAVAISSLGPSLGARVDAVVTCDAPRSRPKTKAALIYQTIMDPDFMSGYARKLVMEYASKFSLKCSPCRKPEEVARGVDNSPSLNLNGYKDLRESVEEKNEKR